MEELQLTFADEMFMHPLAKIFAAVCYAIAFYFIFNGQFIICLLFWIMASVSARRIDATGTKLIRHYMGLEPRKPFTRFANKDDTDKKEEEEEY